MLLFLAIIVTLMAIFVLFISAKELHLGTGVQTCVKSEEFVLEIIQKWKLLPCQIFLEIVLGK